MANSVLGLDLGEQGSCDGDIGAPTFRVGGSGGPGADLAGMLRFSQEGSFDMLYLRVLNTLSVLSPGQTMRIYSALRIGGYDGGQETQTREGPSKRSFGYW